MTPIQHNTFKEIKHIPLRVFNRVVYLQNLMEDKGQTVAREYAELFSDVERKQMYLIGQAIKSRGVDTIRKEVTKDLVVTYDPAEELMV